MRERTSSRLTGGVGGPSRVPRLVRWAGREAGGALVVVLAIIAAVLLIGSALFILGTSEAGVVEYTVDSERALWLAEAGLERAQTWLGESFLADSGFDPVGTEILDQPLRAGEYGFRVTGVLPNPTGMDAFEVVSTGEKDGAVRQVRAVFEAESFSRYQWFIENAGGGYSWFHTGERFEGPVHVNGDIKIDGDPWFGGLVTAGGELTMKVGSNPTFVRGYRLHVESVDLPTISYVHSTLKAAALDVDGLYGPPLGNKTYYVVEFGDPSPGYLTYSGHEEDGTQIGLSTVVDISLLNGAAWFEETVKMSGTVDGQMTIGVNGNIEILDDIIYEGSTPGYGPDPDCDDVLGLIAAGHPQGDIIVKKTVENMDDVEIHAVMMALQKNIEAEDYQHGPPRGTITVYGSMLADYSIHLGQYVDDVVVSGYYRDYHYDNRDFAMPPPFFPYTGSFVVLSWEEVVPPVIS